MVTQRSTPIFHTNGRPWYQLITVEPVMFLYMMAYMITSVPEQTFYLFRTCTVNHGYSEEICYNISSYDEINKEVQVTASTFFQWNGIANHAVPIVLAFFIGAYSDKRGRKIILLAGLLGKLYFSFMMTIIAMNPWPVEYVIYLAALPSALTGSDLAIFTGCFAYLADVSSLKNRTLRVGILDAVYLSTMPTGIAIGDLVYKRLVDRSFTAMFAINTSLMVLATLYCVLTLKWQSRAEQVSMRDAGVRNPIKDFFDLNNIKQSVTTLTKKRSHNRRMFLWFLLISTAFYTFQRDEKPFLHMYTLKVFQWDSTTYSNFRTYLSASYVILTLFGIPLMNKVLHWRDTATEGSTMFVGATAAALGPCVVSLIRSMTSKLLAPSERGVAFAFLLVMENVVGMFASVIYTQVYKATIDTDYINSIFYLTMSTQAVVFTLALFRPERRRAANIR
ncbi:unnamed protein product [Leptidea sinapis]|uniref:Major facilitator superfamily (MFS) profile domain-containing protein n=2 Tax=Leptidea sinapis TaxID=189913 RepID=A0A5E4QX51_9NEOP|nr:unnamed protein product [Leptidea sinapis]